MFAFALWDELAETLILARDRVGIKPLYYCLWDGNLYFASEMKAILADPSVPKTVRRGAVSSLLCCHFLPGETTLFQDIRKLLPGHYMIVRDGSVRDVEYWDLVFPAEKNTGTEDALREELTALLRRTVAGHLISDVPVGFLLSGGMDSTALLSFAVELADRQVSTFTIGFHDGVDADERHYARIAANRFGTQHYDMTIGAADFANFLPRYVWHMEEPVCEPPAVALYYVTELARRHVKVLLSGEGGDEAFGGYRNYRQTVLLERIKGMLGPLAPVAGAMLRTLNSALDERRIGKFARLLGAGFEEYYRSRTADSAAFAQGGGQALFTDDLLADQRQQEETDGQYWRSLFERSRGLSLVDRMLYLDTKTWLPDDLLVKADKMTMANSVELRVPLLDHQVLEFAASLRPELKLRGRNAKYILKKAFAGRVPDEIIDRKKVGFPVPYERWISGELHGYVRDLLLDERTVGRGYFRTSTVSRLLEENRRRSSFAKELFLMVGIELWHRQFADNQAKKEEPCDFAHIPPSRT
jgi:asparagine synthase (glutamine-hydrolysing)